MAAKAEGKKSMIEVVELKPKQSVLDLSTGSEVAVEFTHKKYVLKPYDPEKDGDREEYEKTALREAAALVQPREKQIEAFLSFATSASYQENKAEAFSKGDFLTQELKSRIVGILRMNPRFAEEKAAVVFDRWKNAYLGKNPGAVQVLERAKASADEYDF